MALEHRQTLAQVVNRTLALCGDYRQDGYDGDWFDRVQVRLVLTRIHLELARRTGALRGAAVIPLEEGVRVYNLPYNCISIIRVSMHGATGKIMFPKSAKSIEIRGANLTEAGEPYQFYRDFLAHDQIGVIPTPDADGATVEQTGTYGVMRSMRDADGNLIRFDADAPPRRIAGVPSSATGGTGLIRGVVSTYGNLYMNYVRAPSKWDGEDDYPDTGLPTFTHQYFRFAAAAELLKTSPSKEHKAKVKTFNHLWMRRCIDRLKVMYAPIYRTEGMNPL